MDVPVVEETRLWSCVIKWTVATSFGWLLAHPLVHLAALETLSLWGTALMALVVAGSLFQALVRRHKGTEPRWWSIGTNTAAALGAVIAVALTHPGSVAGALQWLFLRRQIRGSVWWIWVSCIGAGIASSIESVVVGGSVYFYFGLAGAVLGLMQWLVLRLRLTSSGWWMVVSPIGWVVGGLGSEAVGAVYHLLADSLSANAALVVAHTAPNMIGGALCGVVTGASLLALLRNHKAHA